MSVPTKKPQIIGRYQGVDFSAKQPLLFHANNQFFPIPAHLWIDTKTKDIDFAIQEPGTLSVFEGRILEIDLNPYSKRANVVAASQDSRFRDAVDELLIDYEQEWNGRNFRAPDFSDPQIAAMKKIHDLLHEHHLLPDSLYTYARDSTDDGYVDYSRPLWRENSFWRSNDSDHLNV